MSFLILESIRIKNANLASNAKHILSYKFLKVFNGNLGYESRGCILLTCCIYIMLSLYEGEVNSKTDKAISSLEEELEHERLTHIRT